MEKSSLCVDRICTRLDSICDEIDNFFEKFTSKFCEFIETNVLKKDSEDEPLPDNSHLNVKHPEKLDNHEATIDSLIEAKWEKYYFTNTSKIKQNMPENWTNVNSNHNDNFWIFQTSRKYIKKHIGRLKRRRLKESP